MSTCIRCENCGKLTFTERLGFFWCDTDCMDAVHRRLLGTEAQEMRVQPKPTRLGLSVGAAWQTLAAAARTTYH